jgi:hypothetical protein
MKKLGFVVLFFVAFAFVVSAQTLDDDESFTVSASVGKFVDIKALDNLELGSLTSLIGGEVGVSSLASASIRANTAWTITASATNLKLARTDDSGATYLTGTNQTIPYTFTFDSSDLITAGALVTLSGETVAGQKSYSTRTNGYNTFTYSVAVAAAALNVNLDSGAYLDTITLTVAAQ